MYSPSPPTILSSLITKPSVLFKAKKLYGH